VPLTGTMSGTVPPTVTVAKSTMVASPAAGENVTETVQLASGTRLDWQVLVTVKSVNAPVVTDTLGGARLIGPMPVLLTVKDCAADTLPPAVEGKSNDAGSAAAEGATPVPPSAVVCVPAVSVNVKVAVSAVAVLGVKVTLATQLPGEAATGAATQVLL
jgi:hypothetical protein